MAAQHSRLGARDTARKSLALTASLGTAPEEDLRAGALPDLELSSDFSNSIISVSPLIDRAEFNRPKACAESSSTQSLEVGHFT